MTLKQFYDMTSIFENIAPETEVEILINRTSLTNLKFVEYDPNVDVLYLKYRTEEEK